MGMFIDHIKEMDERAEELHIPDFSPHLKWMNTPPLSFQHDLKGKIVVLDFWAYCCINCMHVLPDLAYLEKKYANEPVVFIGVHSPKFENEKGSPQLACAIQRYEVQHPVVNDPDMTLWRQLGVRSWPTIVIVGPKGNLLMSVSGEGNRETLDAFIAETLEFYREERYLRFEPSPRPSAPLLHLSPFSFPGKIAIDVSTKRLFVSDSNHNQIVICTLEGKPIDRIGDGERGLQDGDYKQARFFRPQGLVYHEEALYVADTENHALRKIDLNKCTVSTLTGNGNQGRDYRGGGRGKEQELSSPWDVAIDPSAHRLYIAMAGTHQIWIYDLTTQRVRTFSGTGAEQNFNSDYALEAAWAQPSGLSLGDGQLFIADSESSTIRAINISKGSTRTLVGGDSNQPYNLFAFGDKEGEGDNARLQHPLAVLWVEKWKKLIVADTYNHRLKILDPQTNIIKFWVGSGVPGHKDGIGLDAQFFEPSGLALDAQRGMLYVADTNNHFIRTVDLTTGVVQTI